MLLNWRERACRQSNWRWSSWLLKTMTFSSEDFSFQVYLSFCFIGNRIETSEKDMSSISESWGIKSEDIVYYMNSPPDILIGWVKQPMTKLENTTRKLENFPDDSREINLIFDWKENNILAKKVLFLPSMRCHWWSGLLFSVLCLLEESGNVKSILLLDINCSSWFSVWWTKHKKFKMMNHHRKIGVICFFFFVDLFSTRHLSRFSHHFLCYWQSLFEYAFTCCTRWSLCLRMFAWWRANSSNTLRKQTIAQQTTTTNLCHGILRRESVLSFKRGWKYLHHQCRIGLNMCWKKDGSDHHHSEGENNCSDFVLGYTSSTKKSSIICSTSFFSCYLFCWWYSSRSSCKTIDLRVNGYSFFILDEIQWYGSLSRWISPKGLWWSSNTCCFICKSRRKISGKNRCLAKVVRRIFIVFRRHLIWNEVKFSLKIGY